MRRSTAAAALIPCALALILTGCGSSAKSSSTLTGAAQTTGAAASPSGPSNAHLSSSQLNDAMDQAIKNVTAMHMKGTMASGGQRLSLDIQVNEDSGGGTIGAGGVSFPVRLVDGVAYVQMTPSVIKEEESHDKSQYSQLAGQLLLNKWLSSNSAAGKSATQDFQQFLDLKSMTSGLTTDQSDTYTYIGTSTVAGQQVAQYKDVSSDPTSPPAVMSVPLSGPALPILIDAGSQGSLTIVWNKPVPVTAPPADQIVTLPTS